jgi:multiple sugar transport system permease protein
MAAIEITGVRARPRRRARRQSRAAPYLFLAPAGLLFLLFILLPVGYAIVLSLRANKVQGGIIGQSAEVFVGLDNYRAVLSDPEFLHSLARLAIYGGIVVPVMLGLALLFALLLDSPVVRFPRFSRIAIFLPYAVPGVIASVLWGFMYLPDLSPAHDVADALGLPAPNFFGERAIFGSVANIAIWGGVGFNMLVMFTALRSIPRDLYDAARIDGCTEVQLALRIKVPLIAPALVMTTLFSLIATLQVFSEPMTLRPLTNVVSSTWVPLLKVYSDGFIDDDIYSAAAASVVLAAVTLVLSAVVLRLVQSRAFREDG